MTKNHLITALALLLLAILSCTGLRERRSGSEIWNRDELVVAMDSGIPGYFTLDGEQFGYHYDILQDYAQRVGATLRVITGKTHSECRRMLESGEADIVASIATGGGRGGSHPAIEIYTTSYVILARGIKSSSAAHKNEFPDMRGRKILVSAGFKSSRGYDKLIDSLRSSHIFICECATPEIIGSLSEGEYDYMICEKSEALLGSAAYPGLSMVYDFADGIRIGVELSKSIEGFRDDFAAWLGEYRSGDEYATLGSLYLENANITALAALRRAGGHRPISPYDDIIRLVAQREGLDWRFLSAIAYHESRFKPHVVSRVGARGIMQVMPVVARNFNIPVEEIVDTETNVTLAAKLLKNIENSMGFASSISGRDKMSILLACYNAGTGHVTDARRLARKYGYDADCWEHVSRFLRLKSQPEYYNDEVVRNGAFRSGVQTSSFVENVMEQYNNYRLFASL